MYQFFVQPEAISIENKKVYITGADVNHIKNVLRMKIGEEINISNGVDGKEYRCAISEIGEDSITCELRFIKDDGNELPSKIILFQGLPKADKFELIVQKCVELGVSEIVPVSMKRCVMKLDGKKEASKISRWQAIAEAAAKQSKRGIIPTIGKLHTFGEALKKAQELDLVLLPYEMADADTMEQTREIFRNLKPGKSVGVFVGPEGGFDESEVSKAQEAGAKTITLGKRILRTETAGLTVMSWLMFFLDGKS